MIDDKRIDKYVDAAKTMPRDAQAELLEIAHLARLGLWAREHGIPTVKWYATDQNRAAEALATLPEEYRK